MRLKYSNLPYGHTATTLIALLIAAGLVLSWTPKMHSLKHEITEVEQITPSKIEASSFPGVVGIDRSHGVATPSSVETSRKPEATAPTQNFEKARPVDTWLDVTVGLLGFVAAFQFAWMFRQEKIISGQTQALADLKALAETQADAARMQSDIAEKVHAAAHLQFIAAHKPHLKIRSLTLEEPKVGEPLSVRINLANTGGSAATIKEGNATILISKDGALPELLEKDEERVVPENPILEIGKKDGFTKRGANALSQGDFNILYPKTKKVRGSIYVYGSVEYADGAGNGHTVAFCRKYNPTTKRFAVVNDPNYESAEEA